MYLHSFNYFRAIAIIFIIAGHTYWVAQWEIDVFWERFIANVFSGGSALFVFISGFLFHHIFFPKYRYRSFMRKKLQNVLVPYFVLSSLPILYWVFIKTSGPFPEFMFDYQGGIWGEYIRPIVLYLWTGNAMAPLWYIPFIMLTFTLSPLHARYISLSHRRQLGLLALFILISLFTHRAPNNLYPLHAVLYYTSAYLFGIYCSIHKQHIYRLLKGKEALLLTAVLLLAALQAWLFPWFSLFAKSLFEWGYPDIMYLQKLILCLFFMIWLHRFEHQHWPALQHLASGSFALYFLHAFVIASLGIVIKLSGIDFSGNVFTWILCTAVVTAATFLLATTVKKWTRSKSRYFIGW